MQIISRLRVCRLEELEKSLKIILPPILIIQGVITIILIINKFISLYKIIMQATIEQIIEIKIPSNCRGNQLLIILRNYKATRDRN
jgi:hypothetical protein